MTPDDSQLQGLLWARAACLEKRRDADRRGALRARQHVLDTELTDIVEAIQSLCRQRGLPLPAGVPPLAR